MIRGLVYAVGFLTRIPVPSAVFDDARARQASIAWYPMVGVLLGGLLAGAGGLLEGRNDLLASALLLLLWVGLTGALHLDGLADSADAWIGGLGDRERTLAIMKDPRCGPAAVVTVVLLLLTKLAALQAMPSPARLLALVMAPVLARAALTALLITTPYVRRQGMASGLAAGRTAPAAAVLLSMLAAFACGPDGWCAVAAAVVVYALWRHAGQRRLGGYTGDTAGALAEMVELAVLVVIALRTG
ncbi:adenosylcobinamide-GDP ribazoletransferase [Frateuria aurantia]